MRRGSPFAASCTLALFTACSGARLESSSAAPEILSIAPTRVSIRSDYAYQVELGASVEPIVWQLDLAPPGMTVSSQGLVTWSPGYDDLGEHAVRLLATSGAVSSVQGWTLRVDQGLLLGLTLSPRGHSGSSTPEDYADHFVQCVSWGRVLGFHGHWRDPASHAGEVPALASTAALARYSYGVRSAVGFGWADEAGVPDLTSDSEPGNNSWTNAETRAEYRAMVAHYAAAWSPLYVIVGHETNRYHAGHDAAEWAAWISEYEECYDAIKAASPTTKVFTTFQLELLHGLGGAVTGEQHAPQWELVDALAASGKADAIGFTSYPFFAYDTPEAIPADHYDEIRRHWSGRVIFAEIGWLSEPSPPFAGSELDQAEFVDVFFARTRELELDYVAWRFLHDWDGEAAAPELRGIGFLSNDGFVARPADLRWRQAVDLREL